MVASTVSALIALLLVRAAGWQLNRLVATRGSNPSTRLRQRGWPLGRCRCGLIPAVPFSVLNYAAGASAVRVLPYTLATLAGLLPGTAAVVILGDALTGNVSPLLFLVSLCTASVRYQRAFVANEKSANATASHHRERVDGIEITW